MYLFIPNYFLVPISYAEEEIVNLKKIIILKGCNCNSDFINETANRKDLVVGVSLPSQREEFWIKSKMAMEEQAKTQEITVKIENADNDVAKQISQVETLISQGIDILILGAIDAVAAEAMVEKANKAGIKVIAYDRLIENSDLDLYVTFNNIRVGELQGRFLTQEVPKGNYIVMYGDIGTINSKLYKEGAMEYIQPLVYKKDIKIVTDQEVKNWDPKNAFKIVEESLTNNKNKINAILAPNDATAGAAIEALQAKGSSGKVTVTGQDADLAAVKRIVQGTQSMTVFKDPRQLGSTSIDAAIKLAKEKTIYSNGNVNNGKKDVPSIFLTPIAIDKNNIDSVLINSGYLKKEDIYEMKKQTNLKIERI